MPNAGNSVRILPAGVRLARMLIAAPVLSLCAGVALAMEVVQPAVDGMVVDTKDSVLQQVKIRLKSFGPGFCEVRVEFAGKVQSFAAPPLTWSDWLPIGPAVSGGAYELAFSATCDTGALGEIKYDK